MKVVSTLEEDAEALPPAQFSIFPIAFVAIALAVSVADSDSEDVYVDKLDAGSDAEA